MPDNSCNIDNVMGKLGAVMDAGGVEMTTGAYDKLTPNAQNLYQQVFSKDKADTLAAGNKPIADKVDQIVAETTADFSERSKVSLKSVVLGSMKPTQLFPEDVTQPILTYIDDFFVSKGGDIGGKHDEFIKGMKQVINSLDDSRVPEWAEAEWNHWRRDLLDGAPFYEQRGNEITKILNNTVANSINLSNNVILGNPVELLVKAPTLYGFRPTAGGIIQALKNTKGNIWGRIPEVEARGYYGLDLQPSKVPVIGKLNDLSKRSIDLVMNTTQRPLLNIAYSIGESKGGVDAGLAALEKIAFANRLGNRPRFFRNQSSAQSLKLMNYTISQYEMIGGLFHGLTQPGSRAESLRGLTTYGMMLGALGGGAAFVPRPLASILEKVEGYKEFEEQYSTPFTKLISPGSVTVGAAQSIWNRTVETADRDFKAGAEKLSNGEIPGALGDFTLVALTFSIGFGQNAITNPRTQRTIRSYIDVYQGDIDTQEQEEKLKKTWVPFYQPAK